MTTNTPLALSIKDACAASGLSRTTIYQAIKAGDLKPRKCGNRTLILREDLSSFLLALPCRSSDSGQ